MRKVITAGVLAAFLAMTTLAQAATVTSWPLATDANDTSGAHNGITRDVLFVGEAAHFNGVTSRITMSYSLDLVPYAADLTVSLDVQTTAMPGKGDLDFDLVRAAPKGTMYKVELYPHGTKAQAQCFFHGAVARINLHAGPTLNDGLWHHVVCHKTMNQVTLTVDDVLVGSANISIGDIKLRSGSPFAFGYKPVPGGTDADFFEGALKNVTVSIG